MGADVFGRPYQREPEFEVVVERDVMVPLRDGVRLATDLYFPTADGHRVADPRPVLLERTPYDRRNFHVSSTYFAQHGYVVAVQDVRGRYGSEGVFYPFAHEAPDGYDTVEWLAAQPWCDGRVGTYGQSYDAAVQSALACLTPPHLAAMIVTFGPSSYFHSSMRHNGALELRFVNYAFSMATTSREAAADPALRAELEQAHRRIDEWFRPGGVQPGQTALRLVPSYEQWCLDILTKGVYDDYWRQPGYGPRPCYDQHSDVPTLYVGGWYDSYTRSTCENFVELSRRQTAPVHLLMGPWTHGGAGQPVAGDATFAGGGLPHYDALRLQWFDQFLLGLPTDLDHTPPVKVFVMGGGSGRADDGRIEHGGTWRGAAAWPIPEMRPTAWYCHAGGLLSTELPVADQSFSEYVFDPDHPVPTIGGQLSAIDVLPGAFDQRQDPRFPGDRDGSPLADRDDVLVFATPPLAEPVELIGPVTARLWVSTDGPDTDFTAKLIDVCPDGTALNLTDSIARLRFREGLGHEVLAEPGQVYELVFELYPTANRFAAGHRIRVDISSSNHPRFDVNPNTGGPLGLERHTRPATNRVHHDRDHPTRLVLPETGVRT